MRLLTAYFLGVLVTGIDGRRSDYTMDMETRTDTQWGIWGAVEYCPEGEYAYKFQLKTEPGQGGGDDTGLNGIKLYCR